VDDTFFTYADSPVGTLMLAGSPATGLRFVAFQSGVRARGPEPSWTESRRPFRDAEQQLKEYFRGTRTTFDLALDPQGTPFQLEVWKALLAIPYGETMSYGQLARTLGNPKAVRAVGLANGRNPLPIMIPCHRVIGRTGSLTGYGGGLPVKDALLALEARVSDSWPARTPRARQRSLF
jgi:methylated-DNA-[protein]-cysteine S-methyltransferase